MKFLIFLLLILASFVCQADTSTPIYSVQKAKSEIKLGNLEDEKGLKNKSNNKKPKNLWYIAINRTHLNHHLPSFTTTPLYDFSPKAVGVTIGRKIENHFSLYTGYYEISGEWHRFERGITTYQNLNLYQLNFFQNFNIAKLKRTWFVSVGLGIAPLYLTSEQSVIANSTSETGYVGMLKLNIDYRMKKNLELDFSIKSGWGNAGGHEVSLTSLSLGLNFE